MGGLLGGRREFVVQEAIEGTLERMQAVFDHGRLVGIHGYRQLAEGLGGGDIAKLGIRRPAARQCIERLGEYLGWHGALSLDYVLQERSGVPVFIDANPRLVEPMNAVFSGVNLADILVRISVGEQISGTGSSPGEARTHMLLMALLFAGAARASRLDIVYELLRALGKRGLYANSQEELLPVLRDYISLVPLGYVLSRLLIDPKSALALSAATVASYSLSLTRPANLLTRSR